MWLIAKVVPQRTQVVITTSSVEGVQGGLEIVHRKMAVPPKPVTPEVGEVRVVMVAVPDTTLHAPVPTVGVLAAKVVAVVLSQGRFWSGPALAGVEVQPIQPKATQVEEEAYHASKQSVVVL